MNPWRLVVVIFLSGGLRMLASAQSIYVDFDIGSGTPQIGAGAPSSGFGGAAGVPGQWNRLFRDDGGPASFFDVNGAATNVVMTWTGSAGGIGFNNPINTGDYALLLNDAKAVGSGGLNLTISGLTPGLYRIFTYAVKPQGEAWTTQITVPGSAQGIVAVTGPMPGNQLIPGITHSIHDIQLTGGPLTIQAAENWPGSYVNGFQILAVPEPTTISVIAFSLAALAARRRRRM